MKRVNPAARERLHVQTPHLQEVNVLDIHGSQLNSKITNCLLLKRAINLSR